MALAEQTPTSTTATMRAGSGTGWAVFVGLMLALAGLKEIGRSLRGHPLPVHPLSASPRERMLAVTLLLRILKRTGQSVLAGR
jgi:hypothetical protein